MAMYSRPEELLKRFVELPKKNQGLLGIQYVATQDENLMPEYPALQVSMGDLMREDHGTQRFLLTFEASFWIYHANYESTRAIRNIEDMEWATGVVRFLQPPNNRVLREGSAGCHVSVLVILVNDKTVDFSKAEEEDFEARSGMKLSEAFRNNPNVEVGSV